MSFLQRLITSIVPKSWAVAMEAESRRWVMRCDCGHETSIWEMGGIRYGASGRTWTRCRCGQCGTAFWGRLHKRETPKESPGR
jgi:hypothetical protein